MRLIGVFEEKKGGARFYSFLQRESVEAVYEALPQKEGLFQLWVIEEEDVERATHWFKEFQKNPEDPRFFLEKHPIDRQLSLGLQEKSESTKEYLGSYVNLKERVKAKTPWTRLMLALCILFYIWNHYELSNDDQKRAAPNAGRLTPLMLQLSYDVPIGLDKDSNWEGLYGMALKKLRSEDVSQSSPLFVKIRQGEVWRLFTPIFLHLNFTHIFFNMVALSILGAQIEERMKGWQYLLLTLVIGMISNTFQYLMSGPFFMGCSGVICGFAGFIWMRQRVAPWEGYPLQRGAFTFLAVFVLGMALLQSVIFFLARFSTVPFSVGIANTAHLSGAVAGMILGRISFFYKEKT